MGCYWLHFLFFRNDFNTAWKRIIFFFFLFYVAGSDNFSLLKKKKKNPIVFSFVICGYTRGVISCLKRCIYLPSAISSFFFFFFFRHQIIVIYLITYIVRNMIVNGRITILVQVLPALLVLCPGCDFIHNFTKMQSLTWLDFPTS